MSVEEIYTYLASIEHRFVLQDYFDDDYTPRMRKTLVNWITEVHMAFSLRLESLYLAIHILDKFLSVRTVKMESLQLVACAALWIASKYEDVELIELKDLVKICADQYTKKDILNTELIILHALNYQLSVPTCFPFIQKHLKAIDGAGDKLKNGTLYFSIISLLCNKCMGYKPSVIAGACIYLTLLKLGVQFVRPANEVIECANSIWAEHSHKKNAAASKYVRSPKKFARGFIG